MQADGGLHGGRPTDIIILLRLGGLELGGFRVWWTFPRQVLSLAFDRAGGDVYTYGFVGISLWLVGGQIDWGRVPDPAGLAMEFVPCQSGRKGPIVRRAVPLHGREFLVDL